MAKKRWLAVICMMAVIAVLLGRAIEFTWSNTIMIVEQQLDAVVRAGIFRDRKHALEEALQTLFATRPHLRTEAAVELFRSGEISFLRAAEMASLDVESFRILLRDRHIPWEIDSESSEDLAHAIQDFFGSVKE